MARRKKRKQKPVEWITYYCEIKAWHVSYWNSRETTVIDGRFVREEADHNLDLQLEVELLEPVKEVKRGTLSLTSGTKLERDARGEEVFERLDYGGLLWCRTEEGERIMSGFVRSSHSGNLALLSLLLAGRRVILDLQGTVFFYREARIRSTGWYTEGHPNYEGEPGCESQL